MAAKVHSVYIAQYNMPNICVVCGSENTSGHIHAGKSSWNGKQNISLEFPVCAECDAIQKTQIKRARWLALFATLGALFGCVLSANLIVDSSGYSNGLAALLIATAAFLFIFWGLRKPFTTRGMTQNQRAIAKHIDKAVRILGFSLPGLFNSAGYIDFQFEDAKFAIEFAALNQGKLI